jgi:predicted Zn-dependent protease
MQTAKEKTGRDLSLVSEGATVQKLQKILDRLLDANLPTYPYHAFVVADDSSNAFTDGKAIYIHSKFTSAARNENDLVAVIAHELAHITSGHLTYDRKILERRQAAVKIVSALIGGAVGVALASSSPNTPSSQTTAENTAKSVAQIADIMGSAAFVAPYNRDQEREADEVGMMMAARAGYNPESFIDFWKHATEVLGASTGGGFLNTHPSHADREKNLEAALPIAQRYYNCAKGNAKVKSSKECIDLSESVQCQKEYCLDARVKN